MSIITRIRSEFSQLLSWKEYRDLLLDTLQDAGYGSATLKVRRSFNEDHYDNPQLLVALLNQSAVLSEPVRESLYSISTQLNRASLFQILRIIDENPSSWSATFAPTEGYRVVATFNNLADLIASPYADFARASVGYARNSDGSWSSIASGQPRRGTAGLLVEPSRTNMIVNNTARSSTTGLALTGTTMAATAAGDSPANDNNGHVVSQSNGATDSMGFTSLSTLAATTYTCSISLKSDSSATWLRLVLSDNVSNGGQIWYNVATNTLGSTNVFGTAVLVGTPSVVAGVNGWYRVTFSVTLPNAATSTLACISVTGDGVNTRATGSYRAWGAQMEQAATGTSPILTSGSAATRAADVLTLLPVAGTYNITVTFDNDSTQVINGTVITGSGWAVPSNLNRPLIKNIQAVAA